MKVRHRTTYYALSLVAGDVVAVFLALSIGFWIKFQSGWLPSPHGIPHFGTYARVFFVVVLFLVATFRAYGLYAEEKIAKFWDEAGLVARAVSVTALLLLALSFFFRDFEFSRGFLFVAWAFVLGVALGMRVLLNIAYVGYRRRHNKLKEVLVVGAGHPAVRYAVRHAREPRLCTRVIGFLDPRHPRLATYRRLPVLGVPAELERILTENENINEVIVALPDMPHAKIIETLMVCEKHLVSFKWLPDILGMVATQMNVRYEFGLPLLYCKESPLAEWENRLLKRVVDVLLSALALAALSPLLGAVAVAIRMNSSGPIFYRQERVGEDGREFMLYKFRTMKQDAEKETGPVWARENDSRRTGIGNFLRRSNIDELPQLWNVLKGDMSLVGPRPERPFFVGRFREDVPRYMGRHRIRSGITGWAQVNGLRGNTSIEERTKYDLFYIENWSVGFDIKILFMTLFAFKNAY